MKRINDVALLSPCKHNLNLHISRANYVANMYINPTRLQMCLNDPINPEWKEGSTLQWADDCFPENVLYVLENFDEKDDDCGNEYEFNDDDEFKSAIVVTVKDRSCYDNLDGKIDVKLCSCNFWKFLLPIQLIFKTQSLLQISTK